MNLNHNSNINKLPLNNESISNDSWLAGFIDADGSFSIRHSKTIKKDNTIKSQISCRIRIEQRMVDPITNQDYLDILNKIAKFFQCNLLTIKQKSTGNSYYTLCATSCKSLKIVLNYFEFNPLYSSKYLDYKD